MKKSSYTQGISIALKVAIVSLAAFYIVRRFSAAPEPELYFERFVLAFRNRPLPFFAVLLLMPLNWFLEAQKWKTICAHRVKIGFGTALKGVLAGLTIGTATPNRIGEFAGRIFMIGEGDRLQLFLLSVVASFCQVLVTVIAGLIAFIFVPYFETGVQRWEIACCISIVLLMLLLPLLARYFPARIREKLDVLRSFPLPLFLQALLLSALRYSVYVFQFVLLLSVAIPSVSLTQAFAGVAVSYLLVTVIPTFSFTEILVRGSVAGAVFSGLSGLHLEFEDAFYVAILLWLINVAVPSLAGAFFVFRLRFFQTGNGK